MKLATNTEWAIIAALVIYIAFTPGLPIVRQLLSTGVGKAAALGVIVYVWKYVSQPIAFLLLVSFLRCASMREGMKNPNAHCPTGFTLSDDNTCKDDKGNQGPPPTICLTGQTWNSSTNRCEGASASTTVGIEPTTLTGPTGNKPGDSVQAPTGPTGPREGFQPNMKDDKYAPA